jgi:hypothetical protein
MRPTNNYVIEATNEDLMDLQASSTIQTDHRYATYQSELAIMRRDMERLKNQTDEFLAKENKVFEHKAHHERLTIRKDNNQPLSAEDLKTLNGLTTAQVNNWLNSAIKTRSDSQAKKIQMMDKIDDIEAKCKKILKEGNNDLVIERGGKHYLRFTSAEVDDYQPMKRSKETVALIFVRILTKCDKLVKLRMEPALELLKEFRDCYSSNDRHYKKFNVVINRIETNKLSCSRWDLSQMMYDLLTPQRQLDYISAITICMKNPLMKKEMEKPASDRPREIFESEQKKKFEFKKPSANTASKFRKTNFRGQSRGRGTFRQNNFRNNRNFQRGNNYQNNSQNYRNNRYNQNRNFGNNFRSNQNNVGYNQNYKQFHQNPQQQNNNHQNTTTPQILQNKPSGRGNFRGINNN